jgi:prepilin-type N-terminal cleavage/methylation domain-containing protein
MKNIFYKKGITVLELLIVLAVFSLLAVVVLPQFSKIRERQIASNSLNIVVESLAKSKADTLASVDGYNYGVQFENNRVIIFRGNTYNSQDVNNVIYNIVSPSSITNISLSGGGSALYFNKLSGLPNKSGSVTLTTGSVVKNITINSLGVLSF